MPIYGGMNAAVLTPSYIRAPLQRATPSQHRLQDLWSNKVKSSCLQIHVAACAQLLCPCRYAFISSVLETHPGRRHGQPMAGHAHRT